MTQPPAPDSSSSNSPPFVCVADEMGCYVSPLYAAIFNAARSLGHADALFGLRQAQAQKEAQALDEHVESLAARAGPKRL